MSKVTNLSPTSHDNPHTCQITLSPTSHNNPHMSTVNSLISYLSWQSSQVNSKQPLEIFECWNRTLKSQNDIVWSEAGSVFSSNGRYTHFKKYQVACPLPPPPPYHHNLINFMSPIGPHFDIFLPSCHRIFISHQVPPVHLLMELPFE